MPRTVDANPTKEFFVNMIVRDIDLADAVLDLLDNSVDGARKYLGQGHNNPSLKVDSDYQGELQGFYASIMIDPEVFEIKDNCGGISIEEAEYYAFRFGRRADAPLDTEGTIGLYGIGMKRALLKMGRYSSIKSSTDDEAFEVVIDVSTWLEEKDWDFPLEEEDRWSEPGTKIRVRQLYPGVTDEFADNAFLRRLDKIIARDYSFIIQNGFSVSLNGSRIEPYHYELRESDEFVPLRIEYEDLSGVQVEVTAGMADVPPEDSSAEEMEDSSRRAPEYYGWFVLCNNRIVLAADRSERTIWGEEDFPKWHPQFNGFMGIVHFYSDDPDDLPWTTTKRDVDESSPVYRRALRHMRKAARQWIDYTTARKRDIERAKEIERATVSKPIREVAERKQMKLPTIDKQQRVSMANILYQKPVSEVNKVRKVLGKANLAYAEVGRITFEYFMENEIGE